MPELGWSREAIEAGARSVQLPAIVHGLFPAAGFELVQFFSRQCDEQLVEHLRGPEAQLLLSRSESTAAVGLSSEFAFVEHAIRYRLELLEPQLASWPQALGLRAQPTNAPEALRQLLHMVDDICYHAGDRSADVSCHAVEWFVCAQQ